MKRFCLLLIISLLASYFAFIPTVSAQTSATVQMTISPSVSSMKVNESKTFTIKLKTSSSTTRVTSVRAILQFNPNILQITNVSTSNLFCQYPTDSGSYASDNSQGVLMITGFSNGTSGCAFPQLTTTEVTFATVTLKAKASGSSDLDFIFTGQNDTQASVALDNNSPPQMVLQAAIDGDVTVSSGSGSTVPDDLGIEDSFVYLGLGGIILGGVILIRNRERKRPERIRIIQD